MSIRVRPLAALATVLLLAGPRAFGQTIQVVEDAKLPRFEVASIRPVAAADRGSSVQMLPNGFVQDNATLIAAVWWAFGIRPYQLPRVPDLIQRDRFSINARAPAGSRQADLPLMLRALLVDRFKLRYHVEHENADGYTLAPARRDGRLGPQLHASPIDCGARLAALRRNETPPPLPLGTPDCNGFLGGIGALHLHGMAMATLVQFLSNQLGAPIIDRTGLTGNFDAELRYSMASIVPPSATAPSPSAADDAPSIFTAVEEQLGLKLTASKTSEDRLVIDHVETPDPD